MVEPMAGYVYVWEFRVAAAQRAAFERRYGADGDWIALFRRGEGYLGTALLRDRNEDGRYLTIDRWRDEAAFRAFRAQFDVEYRRLDAACEGLTVAERSLGDYSEA
ncbi:MAG: antibiotic biosynthesis monooxygenase [Xanthomonadaceae bacterium]|nr:antibiotic biosynthesis monooxygenase [Xanthomonadaceae bacterium]